MLEVIVREVDGEPAEEERAGKHPEIEDAERDPLRMTHVTHDSLAASSARSYWSSSTSAASGS